MGWFIVLLIAGYFAYHYLTSELPKKTTGAYQRESLHKVDYDGQLPGPGKYGVDIVGESKYQDNLEKLAGGRDEESVEIEVVAVLILEDNNPYDSNAVRVDIEGITVGYFSRSDAVDYRRKIAEPGAQDKTLACKALIVGGWERVNDKGHFGVKLDLPTDED